jgi:hypothetical protein
MLVVGGRDSKGMPLSDVWAFTPTTGSWRQMNVRYPVLCIPWRVWETQMLNDTV